MNTLFLIAQATYTHVEIGLFNGSKILAQQRLEKSSATQLLIKTIDQLLLINNCLLHDLSFIAVNRGPAPFTTLRVVLATMNGISFASGIKLVGVDGLRTFVLENTDTQWPYTAYLLNAFNNDVYFAIEQPNSSLEIGCMNSDQLIEKLSSFKEYQWRFLGNGVPLFQEKIRARFTNFNFPPSMIDYCSLQFLAQQAIEHFQHNQFCGHQVLPLYLKETSYKKTVQQ